ncbi:hypothetical protein [Bacteroides propionicifaciens]|jgi:hypothetical protein|uniref:hypothetical protein n=1 Tax=Bacteroides propionicifaciens TaxID=392838 RepID=UPI0003AB00E8|nr:hypothetical protein [Bacteroides propionicifaciens]
MANLFAQKRIILLFIPLKQVYLLLLASYFVIQKGLRFGNGSPAKKCSSLRFTLWKNKAVQGTKDSRTVLLRYVA